jgi:hypothetical protein
MFKTAPDLCSTSPSKTITKMKFCFPDIAVCSQRYQNHFINWLKFLLLY